MSTDYLNYLKAIIMKSTMFSKERTPVQFICTDNKIINFNSFGASVTEELNINYKQIYLNQEETDFLQLLKPTNLNRFLIHVYAKRNSEYTYSDTIKKELILWYIDGVGLKEVSGYLVCVDLVNHSVEIGYQSPIYMHLDIGITKDELDTLKALHDLNSHLAYPMALKIAKKYQPNIEDIING